MTVDITISDLDIMTGAINYRHWLFGQVSAHLGSRVLEIGAGVGNYTEFMLDRECVVCLEIHSGATARLRERFAAKPNVHIYQGDIADARLRSLSEHRCDSALCFNILEHVEDHVLALQNIAHILVPGGRLLIIVPAVPWIMGTVDQSLGHYRRYTPNTLQSALTAAGYHTTQLTYMNFPGVCAWLLNNRILHRQEESSGQILLYDRAIVPWISRIERLIPPPIGLSLVCVAEHPGT